MAAEPRKFTVDDLKDIQLDAHATLLGHVSLAWTELHETMASIFAALLSPDSKSKAWAVWHSVGNDRTQRGMLLAVAAHTLESGDKRFAELKWSIDQMDSLENKRNDALHSPYTIAFEDRRLKLIPNHFTGNKRALNLQQKADLWDELRSYRENIGALNSYLRQIGASLSGFGAVTRSRAEPLELPPRPSLPRPAHANARKHPTPRARPHKPPRS
jgi:hypothetical protein